jgi:hypothetical protein
MRNALLTDPVMRATLLLRQLILATTRQQQSFTMSVKPTALAVLIGFSAVCNASTPQLPPPHSDPKMAEVAAAAATQLNVARAGSYLDFPANPQPWPCEVSDYQQRRLAWVLNDDEMDEKVKLAFRKAAINSGTQSKDMKMSYKDAIFAPLVASCKDGKLDGPLEFFVEYTRAIESPASTMEMRMRVRQSMVLAAGEQVYQTPVITSLIIAKTNTIYKDPSMQAMMAKLKIPEIKSFSTTYTLPLSADDYYIATITDMGDHGWMTILQRPTGPNRSEMLSYKGANLLSVTPMKIGLPHGEQRMMEQKYGSIVVPAKSTCYEDGEVILTTQCDVQ